MVTVIRTESQLGNQQRAEQTTVELRRVFGSGACDFLEIKMELGVRVQKVRVLRLNRSYYVIIVRKGTECIVDIKRIDEGHMSESRAVQMSQFDQESGRSLTLTDIFLFSRAGNARQEEWIVFNFES